MKVADLSGARLDYWVARAEGWQPKSSSPQLFKGNESIVAGKQYSDDGYLYKHSYYPSEDWELAGQIIARERIALQPIRAGAGNLNDWVAVIHKKKADGMVDIIVIRGATPLEAAMRCYAVSKFGDEVPDEIVSTNA